MSPKIKLNQGLNIVLGLFFAFLTIFLVKIITFSFSETYKNSELCKEGVLNLLFFVIFNTKNYI